MRLKEIIEGVKILSSGVDIDEEIEILNLTHKIDEITHNTMFFSLNVLSDKKTIKKTLSLGGVLILSSGNHLNGGCIEVENVREAMGICASNFYKHPKNKLVKIGVVGTNGKTTTTMMIAKILREGGRKVATIGTLGSCIEDELIYTGLTTPDPIDLHRIFSECCEKKVEFVVLEISAHAIYLEKMSGIVIDLLVFTNFSHDHLDFFKTLDKYARVKKSFFDIKHAREAIVNIDDELGKEIYKDSNLIMSSYGIKNKAHIHASVIESGKGVRCTVEGFGEKLNIKSNFYGEFNVYNMLLAVATTLKLSIGVKVIEAAFEKMEGVKGRFCIFGEKKKVIVDFAHTPESLKNLLIEARKLSKGRLITVFGCGGNRDKLKRPKMGMIAGELSDFTILTSDNCRLEKAQDIIIQIEDGIKKTNAPYKIIEERKKAIFAAVSLAKTCDIVVVAGKGGEEYIENEGVREPYSDESVVLDLIRRHHL
jgi:UDP-N-acetylmuramoyl-L-alanyl-D-glutamate--2,6-diaminopimelate ligase